MADDVTAELAGIRADLSDGAAYPHRVMEIHAPRLLAAAEAVLKLADMWGQEAGRLQQVAREQVAHGASAQRRGTTGGLAVAHMDCAKALREAITAALAGEETGDGKAE